MSHTDSASPINTIIIKIILHTYLGEFYNSIYPLVSDSRTLDGTGDRSVITDYWLLIADYCLLIILVLTSSQQWGLIATRRQMLTHFPTVTQSAGFQPEPLLTTETWNLLKPSETFWNSPPPLGGVWGGIPSPLPRLEAYTFSNRGRSLRIVNTVKTAGWKSVPKQSIIRNLL